MTNLEKLNAKEFFEHLITIENSIDATNMIIAWFAFHTKRTIYNWVFDIAEGYHAPEIPDNLYDVLMNLDLNLYSKSVHYGLLIQISHLIHKDGKFSNFIDKLLNQYEATRNEMQTSTLIIQEIYSNWDKLRVQYGLVKEDDVVVPNE